MNVNAKHLLNTCISLLEKHSTLILFYFINLCIFKGLLLQRPGIIKSTQHANHSKHMHAN